jgi:O-antigen/teichoic acid export membrane protein
MVLIYTNKRVGFLTGPSMSNLQRIAKNAAVLLIAQVISYLLGFLYVMYTARYLKAEGFGILSFALAFTGIFGVFADFGFGRLIVREVARDKSLAPKYLANISIMKVILVTITFGLIVLVINLLGYPAETIKVVYLIALSVIFSTFTGMLNSIFQAFERMEYMSLGQILKSILMLSCTIFAIKSGFSVIGFAFFYFLVSFIVLGYSFIILRWKFNKLVFASAIRILEIDWSFWIPTIKEAMPFGLTGISGMIYAYMDSVMLSFMKGDEVVGWYHAAYRLVLILLVIPGIVSKAIFPTMSQFYVSSQSSLKFTHEKYVKLMLIVGIPTGIGTLLLADRIILLIFGPGYIESIIALKILIWTIVITFAGAASVKLLESINRQIIVTKMAGLAMVVNIVLNIVLIPKYSYKGASVATVITELILVGGIFIYTYKNGYGIQGKKLMENISKTVIAGLTMGAFLLCFQRMNLLILVLLGMLVYFGTLYAIRGFDKKDIQLLKRSIKPEEVVE